MQPPKVEHEEHDWTYLFNIHKKEYEKIYLTPTSENTLNFWGATKGVLRPFFQ